MTVVARESPMPEIKLDWRFIDIEYELWALGESLGFIGPQIQGLGDQERIRRFAELREKGWDEDEGERALVFHDLDALTSNVLPRFFRGPFLVALWAAYESAALELADYERNRLHLQPGPEEGRGALISRVRRYYDEVLGLPHEMDSRRWDRLIDLMHVRNAIAHGNAQ
jgi:hypothetical protein